MRGYVLEGLIDRSLKREDLDKALSFIEAYSGDRYNEFVNRYALLRREQENKEPTQ